MGLISIQIDRKRIKIQRFSSSHVKMGLFLQISSEDFEQLFQKQEYIGSGTQGDVYKAKMGKDLVSIKYIRKPYLKADSINYIQSEIQALKNINHEGILGLINSYQIIYGPRESQRRFCIVTEYCRESISNYHIIRNLNNETKLKMCLELASAVKAAHQKNILHRDIKPENILMKDLQDMTIKLADFGCCKMDSDPHLSMTKTIGTPLYSDPNFSSGKYTNKCDVYSMVLVMVYIFCGKQYFSDCKTMEELIEKKRRFYTNTEHQAREFLERYGLDFSIEQFLVNISIFALSNDQNNRLTSGMLHYLVQKQIEINRLIELNNNQFQSYQQTSEIDDLRQRVKILENYKNELERKLKESQKRENQLEKRINQLQKQRDQQDYKPAEEKSSIRKRINFKKQQTLKPIKRYEEIKENIIYQGQIIQGINEQQLIHIIQQHSHFKHLKTINLWERQITDAGFKTLADNSFKFNNLQTIDLRTNHITDAGLKAFAQNSANFNNLQTIYLAWNQITGAGLKALAEDCSEFNNLQTIYLWGNKITDVGLKALAENCSKFPKLSGIYLGNNQITDAGLKALAYNSSNFNNLQGIDLNNNQITDAGLKALTEISFKFNNLQTLYLHKNKITDAGLKALSEISFKFNNLQTLYLHNNQITDAGLKTLAENSSNFNNLQTINLGWNQISDAGLKALAENSSNFNNLQYIDLSNNKITDAGLEALAENSLSFNDLQHIDLSNNKITDAGLEALAENNSKFPNLQTINLGNNKISSEYLKYFCSLNLKIGVWM